MDHAKELKRTTFRDEGAAHLDPGRFLRELRVRFGQLAIEQKRRIGVEAFLQFVQSRVRIIPGARLVHDEQDFVPFRIMREQVDHAGFVVAVRGLTFDVEPLHLKL